MIVNERRSFLHFHIISGLHNISFGLPKRSLINRTFLTLAMAVGIDCAIADSTNKNFRETLLARELLFGHDRLCLAIMKLIVQELSGLLIDVAGHQLWHSPISRSH